MNVKHAQLLLFFILPLLLAPQEAPVEDIGHEPHHHLVLQNEFVKVYEVNLPARDRFPRYRNDADELTVVLGNATTVTASPGQADVLEFQKDGQLHFSSSAVQEVRNIGQTPFRSVSIDFRHPQTGARNLCARALAGRPLQCPTAEPSKLKFEDQPQLETDQLRVTTLRVAPRGSAPIGNRKRDELIVAVDEMAVVNARSVKNLQSGDSIWLGRKEKPRNLKNIGDKEARAVILEFKP